MKKTEAEQIRDQIESMLERVGHAASMLATCVDDADDLEEEELCLRALKRIKELAQELTDEFNINI